MVSHKGGTSHQGRDDASGSIYNHPAIVFFAAILLCVCITSPMIWMLWSMRNDNREDVMNEGQLYRLRNWKRVKVFQKQQQQAAQQPIVQNDGEEVIVGNGQTRLSNVISSLRKFAVSIPQAVVSKSQLLGTTISQRFMEITRPAPRRGRSQSRAGVSIDLPIMRQPAWQQLASGSGNTTPSTTFNDFSKPISPAEVDITDMAASSGHRYVHNSSAKSDTGLVKSQGGIDGATGAEQSKSQAEIPIGLAMG